MLKKSILPTLFALIFLLQGCSGDKNEEANSIVSANEHVLTSLKNTQYIVTQEADGFKLENAEGKVVIYDIFATWCPPCRKAVPHLSSLQEKYKDDLIIIGITIEDNVLNAKLEDFKTTYNANYIFVNSDANRPLADKIVDSLGLGDRYPIPVMALYKDGKYITHYIGAIEEEFIESDIKRALRK